jgi:hypothetical protein
LFCFVLTNPNSRVCFFSSFFHGIVCDCVRVIVTGAPCVTPVVEAG